MPEARTRIGKTTKAAVETLRGVAHSPPFDIPFVWIYYFAGRGSVFSSTLCVGREGGQNGARRPPSLFATPDRLAMPKGFVRLPHSQKGPG